MHQKGCQVQCQEEAGEQHPRLWLPGKESALRRGCSLCHLGTQKGTFPRPLFIWTALHMSLRIRYHDVYGEYWFNWHCPMLLPQIQAAIFQTFMFRQINVEFFVENYTLGEITKTPEELLRDSWQKRQHIWFSRNGTPESKGRMVWALPLDLGNWSTLPFAWQPALLSELCEKLSQWGLNSQSCQVIYV